MAVELAQAYVSINPSMRGFKGKLSRELGPAADSAGSTAGDSAARGFGRSFVPGLKRIGKTAGIALSGGLAAAGIFGVKVAADFQQTQIAFEGILGSAEKAKDLLGDLRDFAAKTPFEFPELADSAKNLLAVGFSAEDVIPLMTDLGNVAATLGVGTPEIKGVVRALGQMKGKGKASAEELQQISEQIPGFSAISAIAEGMGITVADAFDKVAAGAVPADDAIGFIIEGMEDFPGAAGAMDRQSKTLNGVLSTFKDTLSGMAIDFITPYLPAISRGVETFSGWIANTVLPALQSFVDFINDTVAPAVKTFVDDALGAIQRWWDRNGSSILAGLAIFGTVALGALSGIADWIWNEGLPALDGFRDWFVNNSPAIAAALAAVAGGFLLWAINAGLAAIATAAANAPVIIALVLIAALAAALVYAYENSDTFRTAVDNAIPIIKDMAEQVWGLVAGVLALLAALDEVAKKIDKDGLAGVLGTVLKSGFPGLGLLDAAFASGGTVPSGSGNYLVGEEGPEILSMGAGFRGGYVTPNPQIGSGGPLIGELHVTQLPGEDAVGAARRMLKWHRQTQLMVASR